VQELAAATLELKPALCILLDGPANRALADIPQLRLRAAFSEGKPFTATPQATKAECSFHSNLRGKVWAEQGSPSAQPVGAECLAGSR
jgi:hypothetical protein